MEKLKIQIVIFGKQRYSNYLKKLKRFKKTLAFILSLSLFLVGCSNISIPTNADAAFRNFTLNLFQQDVTSTTLGLHYTVQNPENYGIENSTITLGSYDIDNAASLAAIENCKATLDKFPYKKLCAENQITYDVLSYHLKMAKEGISYSLYDEPLSPVTGIHAQLPVLLAEYQFAMKKLLHILLSYVSMQIQLV